MKISEVMTRNVETITPDQPVSEAAGFMLSADTGSIPVIENDKLVGMITDRDIAVRGVANGRGPDTAVRDLMTSDVVSVRERSKNMALVLEALQSPERDTPEYITMDGKGMSATFVRIPELAEVPYPVKMEPNLVIEFYAS